MGWQKGRKGGRLEHNFMAAHLKDLCGAAADHGGADGVQDVGAQRPPGPGRGAAASVGTGLPHVLAHLRVEPRPQAHSRYPSLSRHYVIPQNSSRYVQAPISFVLGLHAVVCVRMGKKL
jgi:hypothetical protein